MFLCPARQSRGAYSFWVVRPSVRVSVRPSRLLWYAISRQQTVLASSNSVYRCIRGRSRTSSKRDDLDLLFQGRYPINA